MSRLAGKIALITGAASGIGAATAARAVFVTGSELVVDGGLMAG